jgi:aerobic carbon-monoxide dehydrogenase large subunit
VGAVIAAAIDDAIGLPGAVTRLPVTPQRLRTLINAAAQRASGALLPRDKRGSQ